MTNKISLPLIPPTSFQNTPLYSKHTPLCQKGCLKGDQMIAHHPGPFCRFMNHDNNTTSSLIFRARSEIYFHYFNTGSFFRCILIRNFSFKRGILFIFCAFYLEPDRIWNIINQRDIRTMQNPISPGSRFFLRIQNQGKNVDLKKPKFYPLKSRMCKNFKYLFLSWTKSK